MQARLDSGLAATADWRPVDRAADPALALEAREMGLRCSEGMLMCLDADQRLALVLTARFEPDTAAAAQGAGTTHDAFRQRLSRARRRLDAFLQDSCGLASASAPCSCERQAAAMHRTGQPIPIRFAALEQRAPPVLARPGEGEPAR